MTGLVHSALRRHRHALAGIADQGVIGIGNLALGLFVLRTSTKTEYGLYGLCYMTLILLSGFANALFLSQLTVSYHRRSDREVWAGAMLCGQILIGALLGLCGVLVALLLPDAALPPAIRPMVMASALACPALMMQDFLRGYFFLGRRGSTALALDLLLIVGWFAGTMLIGRESDASSALAALVGFGLAALVAGVTGLRLSRLPLRLGPSGLRAAVVEAWDQGRWALGGAAVTALQNQAHVYILAWIVSARALAELNAARMLMMPAGLLILGVGRSLTPAMARLAAESRPVEMRRLANVTLVAIVALVALYATAIGLGYTMVIGQVLGSSYDGIGHLVALWAVILILQAVDANFSIILQVTRRFRELTIVNLWTVGPVLLAAVPMIRLYGPEGNLLTVAGGYAAMALLLLPRSRRAIAGLPSSGPVTTPLPCRGAEPLLGASL